MKLHVCIELSIEERRALEEHVGDGLLDEDRASLWGEQRLRVGLGSLIDIYLSPVGSKAGHVHDFPKEGDR